MCPNRTDRHETLRKLAGTKKMKTTEVDPEFFMKIRKHQ